MKNEYQSSFNKINVPHIGKFIDVSGFTQDHLRQNVFSFQEPILRVCSFGVLLKEIGFTSGNVDCAACLLISDIAELRGSTMATIFSAINDRMTFLDHRDADLLIQIVRNEPSPWLKPWALALRHALSDETVGSDALDILNDNQLDVALADRTGILSRALKSMARRIIDNDNVEMFVF